MITQTVRQQSLLVGSIKICGGKGGKLVSDYRQYITTKLPTLLAQLWRRKKIYFVIIIPSFVLTYHPVGGPR